MSQAADSLQAAVAHASYTTLTELSRFEQDVKKSRFLVIAAAVTQPDEALAFFKAHHVPEASHNCWAYKIGTSYRFNDDGEPGGTAGKPILQAIEGQGLDGVAVLVVRWFGGVKLGAGGLVRAYGGSAAQCLRAALKREVIATRSIRFVCNYADQGSVRQRLQHADARDILAEFDTTWVRMSAQVPLDRLAELEMAIADITRGKSEWQQD